MHGLHQTGHLALRFWERRGCRAKEQGEAAMRGPKSGADAEATRQAGKDLNAAEAGNAARSKRLQREQAANAEAVEAVEQTASDGPEGRGLSR